MTVENPELWWFDDPPPSLCAECAAGQCPHSTEWFIAQGEGGIWYGPFSCDCPCDPLNVARTEELIEETQDLIAEPDRPVTTTKPDLINRSPARLYTTKEAAATLGVKEALISKWKTREKVRPRRSIPGRGRGGVVPLYDLEDLRPLVDAYLSCHPATRRDR